MSTAVEVHNLVHRYGKRVALSDLSFSVDRGSIFGLLGPNGSGKSTAFRILSTQLKPQKGDLKILGLSHSNSKQIRSRIGVVFQSPALDKKLTVVENLRIQGWLYGMSGRLLGARIEEVLTQLGILDRISEQVEFLSGGLQRRVEIAKALLHRPAVLILDEPTNGLDPLIRKDLLSYFRQLRESTGMTLLFTTHYLEEADVCDTVGLLDEGKLVAFGSPSALRDEVSGEVISIRTPTPESLKDLLTDSFGLEVQKIGAELRITLENGHKRIADLMEQWPDQIESVRIGKPTLEDFFIHHTGQQYEGRELT